MEIHYKIVGVSGVTRKLTKFDKWITTQIPQLTRDQTIDGSSILVQLMPKQTNAMIQAVKVIPKGTQWTIVSRTPSGQKGGARPYHVWYNEGKRGWYKYGRKRTGEYHYYEKTVKALKQLYPEKVRNSLKNV